MSGRRRTPLAERLGRGLALLLALGCFSAIAWSVRESERPAEVPRPAPLAERPQPAAAPARPRSAAPDDSCRAQKEREIEAIRAQGELTAERRMRIRQIEARACE